MKRDARGPLDHLEDALLRLEQDGLRRAGGRPVAGRSFCSNDYLGLASRSAPHVESGAGGSRLIAGEHVAHSELERSLATWLGVEACLAFSSGYAANVGAISALANTGDLVVSDALNHASLIDGSRLSRSRVVVTPHNDLGAIDAELAARSERHAWVVVESYYSMDADGPDLAKLRKICDAHSAALLVDEAHALGVLGPGGRGRCAEAGVRPDVLIGTLGKAFGSQGAFVAGTTVLREWLWNRARSFVFSTGLSPAAAVAARVSLDTIQASPHLREHVARLAQRLREGLSAANLPVVGTGHVIPVLVGDSAAAVRLAAALEKRGVLVSAIRPPTVPPGTARLRFTVSAAHTEADIDHAVAAYRRAVDEALS